MASVSLKNICKKYKTGLLAVDNFNLDIKDKEFIVLVGPSGCGKSTTLRMVAGLEEITSGELIIDDKVVNDVEPKDRNIAMVFQNYALYPHMSVYENMAFSLKLRKENKTDIKKKVMEAARVLGIEDLMSRKPKNLSGGQRQRVAIGRAIVRNPMVFLMDEPLSNLDAKLRNKMRAELVLLRRKINTTFIYVTHDQVEAMTLGDRIVIMDKGIVQQIGTAEQVFTRPKNLFVAGFIGTPKMNMFNNAKLILRSEKYFVQFFDEEFEVDSIDATALYANKQCSCDIVLGIRPEHILVCDEMTNQSFTSKVNVCEMLGSETYFHTELKGEKIIIKMNTTSKSFELQKLQQQNIIYKFMPENMHLFDANNGNNLLIEKVQE